MSVQRNADDACQLQNCATSKSFESVFRQNYFDFFLLDYAFTFRGCNFCIRRHDCFQLITDSCRKAVLLSPKINFGLTDSTYTIANKNGTFLDWPLKTDYYI